MSFTLQFKLELEIRSRVFLKGCNSKFALQRYTKRRCVESLSNNYPNNRSNTLKYITGQEPSHSHGLTQEMHYILVNLLKFSVLVLDKVSQDVSAFTVC